MKSRIHVRLSELLKPTSALTRPFPRPALALGAVLCLALTGCNTNPSRVDRLLQHPEFPDAARFAPNFTNEALKTISELENRR